MDDRSAFSHDKEMGKWEINVYDRASELRLVTWGNWQ